MGIYYEFLWQQHFNQIISLFSKPLQCLKNQMLCFFEFTGCKIFTASFDFAFFLWKTHCFHMLDFFYWKQPRNRWWGGSKFVKSEKSSGLLLPPLSSKDNIEHRDGEKGRVLSLENNLTGSWSNGGPKAAHVTDSASCNVHRSGDRS